MTGAIGRGIRASIVTALSQGLKLLVGLVGTVVLARLLRPEDFGLVAMVGAFVALGDVIRDLGTSVVGLGRPDLSHRQASNLFWISSGLGAACALVLALSTPLLVRIFAEPRLALVTPVLAFQLLLAGLSAQFLVHLAREMRYWRRLVLEVVPLSLALVLAVATASMGFGYWALVVQAVAVAALRLVMAVVLSGWFPRLPSRAVGNRALIADSSAFGLAQLAGYVSQNIDSILIGARWDATSLGAYDQAFKLLTLPNRQMVGPFTHVVIPTVNRAVKEGGDAHEVLLRVQFALGLIVNWVYTISAGLAPWLIPFALGEQWTDSVPIFRILAVGGAVWVFSTVSYWSFILSNLGRQLLLYNIVSKGLTALLILGASFIGVHAIAWAVSVGLVVSWPLNLLWLRRTADQPSARYLRNGMTIFSGTVAGYAVTAGLLEFGPGSMTLSAALVAALAGTLAFLAVIAALPNGAKQLAGVQRQLLAALRSG
ncbi:MAG TPA: lipopolysaccharide biosynthesis protein [Trueperaceae bacterium]